MKSLRGKQATNSSVPGYKGDKRYLCRHLSAGHLLADDTAYCFLIDKTEFMKKFCPRSRLSLKDTLLPQVGLIESCLCKLCNKLHLLSLSLLLKAQQTANDNHLRRL